MFSYGTSTGVKTGEGFSPRPPPTPQVKIGSAMKHYMPSECTTIDLGRCKNPKFLGEHAPDSPMWHRFCPP